MFRENRNLFELPEDCPQVVPRKRTWSQALFSVLSELVLRRNDTGVLEEWV